LIDAPPTRRELALVAAGGAIGTAARYGLAEAFPVAGADFPATTLFINLAGAFALGLLLELLVRRGRPDAWARLFLGIGALGAFTTFSTFTVEVAGLLRDDEAALAGAYLGASLVGGLLACLAGLTLAGWRAGRIPDEGES